MIWYRFPLTKGHYWKQTTKSRETSWRPENSKISITMIITANKQFFWSHNSDFRWVLWRLKLHRLNVQQLIQDDNKKQSKVLITGPLCKGIPLASWGFSFEMANSTESILMPWRHHQQGWRLLNQFPGFLYSHFSILSKHWSGIEYHGHIWHMSPTLSCGDICQICLWLEENEMQFHNIISIRCGEINQRIFSNPTPGGEPTEVKCTYIHPNVITVGQT